MYNTYRYIKHKYYDDVAAIALMFEVHRYHFNVAIACLSPHDFDKADKKIGRALCQSRINTKHHMSIRNITFEPDVPLVNQFLIHLLYNPFEYRDIIKAINNTNSKVRLPVNAL